MSFTSSLSDLTEDLLIICLGQSVADFFSDLAPQRVVSKGLIEIIHECRADEKVITDDGLLGHRGITTTQDGFTRLVVGSFHTTSEDELHSLTILEGTALNSSFSDRRAFIGFEHLAGEQFQIGCVLGIISSTKSKRGRTSIINPTYRSYKSVSHNS